MLLPLALVAGAFLFTVTPRAGPEIADVAPVPPAAASGFDARAWRGETVWAPPYPRRALADGLVRDDMVPAGTPRAQVLALLGPHDREDRFVGALDDSARTLAWWVGPERGAVVVDSEWLLVTFDASDRVRSVGLVTD